MTPIQVLVKDILLSPLQRKWTLQGFGMLRCYLPGDARLNVWDERYQFKPKPSMIHTHPWDFESHVICGTIINRVYGRQGSDGKIYYERIIKPGTGTEILKPDQLVILYNKFEKRLDDGDKYSQSFDVIHETLFADGTVTLNLRDRKQRPDEASVFFEAGQQWETAEPRVPTDAEIKDICSNAITRFLV